MLNTAHSESVCSVLPIIIMCDLPTSFPHLFLILCLVGTFVSVFCLFSHQPTVVAVSIMSGLWLLCSAGIGSSPVCGVCSFSLRKKKILAIICHGA